MTEFDNITVGPTDSLVLIVKRPVTQAEMHSLAERVPESMKGRVLVLQAEDFGVRIVRGGAS